MSFLNIILIGGRGLDAFVLMTRGNINLLIVSFCKVDSMLKKRHSNSFFKKWYNHLKYSALVLKFQVYTMWAVSQIMNLNFICFQSCLILCLQAHNDLKNLNNYCSFRREKYFSQPIWSANFIFLGRYSWRNQLFRNPRVC